LFAQDEMKAVVAGLGVESPEFGPVQERQAAAVAELEAALALLVPPEDREGEDESDSEESSEEESGGEGEQEQAQEDPPAQPQDAADPAQLLQSVRDKEAQRRRDRDQKANPGYETVEKDW
jgi:hypothetical protein